MAVRLTDFILESSEELVAFLDLLARSQTLLLALLLYCTEACSLSIMFALQCSVQERALMLLRLVTVMQLLPACTNHEVILSESSSA